MGATSSDGEIATPSLVHEVIREQAVAQVVRRCHGADSRFTHVPDLPRTGTGQITSCEAHHRRTGVGSVATSTKPPQPVALYKSDPFDSAGAPFVAKLTPEVRSPLMWVDNVDHGKCSLRWLGLVTLWGPINPSRSFPRVFVVQPTQQRPD